MNAKDFLRQAKKYDMMIKNKLFEVEQWKAIATGTTAQMGGERVQSSGSQQKMADAVSKYIDIEMETNKCIDKLIDAKNEIIEVIEQLNATEYDVLHKIYIQYMTLEDVADIYEKTYSWITTVHGRALKHVQDILDKTMIEM